MALTRGQALKAFVTANAAPTPAFLVALVEHLYERHPNYTPTEAQALCAKVLNAHVDVHPDLRVGQLREFIKNVSVASVSHAAVCFWPLVRPQQLIDLYRLLLTKGQLPLASPPCIRSDSVYYNTLALESFFCISLVNGPAFSFLAQKTDIEYPRV